LLFCSIALDTSKQKKIVHMVRIPLAWLVECGRFRECLGNNPSRPKWKQRIGRMASVFKILTERTSVGDFPLKSCILGWVGTVPVKDSLNFCWCYCFSSQLNYKWLCLSIIKKIYLFLFYRGNYLGCLNAFAIYTIVNDIWQGFFGHFVDMEPVPQKERCANTQVVDRGSPLDGKGVVMLK
jgi:hypothetical protein